MNLNPMPDDFHAYKSNYPSGCSDAQVSEHFDGGGDVEWGEEEFDSNNQNQNRPNQTELNCMKLNEMFPSRYLKADDIDDEVAVVIANLKWERMKDDDGKEEDKPVLYFLRVEKGLVLNKTNATTISEQHGDETESWAGKKVILIKSNVPAFGKMQWAIRVKAIPPPSSGSNALKGAKMEAVADPADSFGGSGQ